MALNVVYLHVQGRLQRCHVSDGDMMVFRYYNSIIKAEVPDHLFDDRSRFYWSVRRSRLRVLVAHKRSLYAEKVVKSGQYLIIKGGLQCV